VLGQELGNLSTLPGTTRWPALGLHLGVPQVTGPPDPQERATRPATQRLLDTSPIASPSATPADTPLSVCRFSQSLGDRTRGESMYR
jgi:hypothetical protein